VSQGLQQSIALPVNGAQRALSQATGPLVEELTIMRTSAGRMPTASVSTKLVVEQKDKEDKIIEEK
jgi:hypothetical protein